VSKCVRIKKNGGLYTQCDGKKEEGEECKVCSKKEKKYGDVKDRMRVGIMEYRDSEGKGPVQYVKIMKKNGWTKERVLLEGKILGVSVPLCHFEEEVGKRGRPRKESVEKGVEKSVEVKKRGRPRKEKKSSNIAGEELIASLLKERDEEVINEDVINEDVINEDVINENDKCENDEEETVVVKYEIGGVTYLKTAENVLYDMESHELVGVWNEKTKQIEVCEDEE
jgi:hypothetical protein